MDGFSEMLSKVVNQLAIKRDSSAQKQISVFTRLKWIQVAYIVKEVVKTNSPSRLNRFYALLNYQLSDVNQKVSRDLRINSNLIGFTEFDCAGFSRDCRAIIKRL